MSYLEVIGSVAELTSLGSSPRSLHAQRSFFWISPRLSASAVKNLLCALPNLRDLKHILSSSPCLCVSVVNISSPPQCSKIEFYAPHPVPVADCGRHSRLVRAPRARQAWHGGHRGTPRYRGRTPNTPSRRQRRRRRGRRGLCARRHSPRRGQYRRGRIHAPSH